MIALAIAKRTALIVVPTFSLLWSRSSLVAVAERSDASDLRIAMTDVSHS